MYDWFIQNKDFLTSLGVVVSLFLTMFSWPIVFYFGIKQQREQIRSNAKMKIYEELSALKKEIDEIGVDLSILLSEKSLPFLEMGWEKNPVTEKLNALKVWQDHVKKIGDKIHEFVGAYRKLWTHSEMWIGAMPQLKKAKDGLFVVQLGKLTRELYAHNLYLMGQSGKEFDWKKWDGIQIEKDCRVMRDRFDEIAVCYMDDYLGLIHNRLSTPIFGYKRKPRDTADMDKVEKCLILTEHGLKEMVVEIDFSKVAG
jgi:hypothetical protein